MSTEIAIAAASDVGRAQLGAPVLIVFTKSGFSRAHRRRRTGRACRSSCSPTAERTYRQLALVWGVIPESRRSTATRTTTWCKLALDAVRARGLAREGDRVVVTAGVPFDVPGTTNLMKVETV